MRRTAAFAPLRTPERSASKRSRGVDTYVCVGWIFACLLPSDRSIGADIVEAPASDPFGRQERPLSGTWSSTIESKAGIHYGLMVSFGPFDQHLQGT